MRGSTLLMIFFSSVAFASTPNHDSLFQIWSKIKAPSKGPNAPIGFYSAGCLSGGRPLATDGDGFAVMRLSRRRFFGHENLIDYLRQLGQTLQESQLPLLLVGDLSPPRGGPMRSGHNSHQSGLDVDLWLNMSSRRPNRRERETWSAISYVAGRKKLRRNWSSTQTRLVALSTEPESVNRAFVSPAIKKHFCEIMPKAPWLYKLRPWWGHEEHIHVRLNCPQGSNDCQSQDALNPKDNGCGPDLEWWFSKEADEEWKRMKAQPKGREFPNLPEACEQIARDIAKLDLPTRDSLS